MSVLQQLPLEVFSQRNFVADFIQLKLTFIRLLRLGNASTHWRPVAVVGWQMFMNKKRSE